MFVRSGRRSRRLAGGAVAGALAVLVGLVATAPAPAQTPPTLSVAGVTVSEGAGAATFTVTLSAAADALAVTWAAARATGDTATAGADFTASSGTSLTIPAGDMTASFAVPILEDTADEPDETFTVTLGGVTPSTAATIGNGTAQATITDNDDEPALRIGDVTGGDAPFEGSAVVFTVTLAPRSGRTVTVDWAASATGAGGDSVEAEPRDLMGTLTGTLTFTAGDTARTIAVATADDTTAEHFETFTVALSGAVNATVADAEGTGEIRDNDPLPVAGVEDASADEGSPVEFTVTLSEESERTATVFWTAIPHGTAEPGDLTGALTGALTFAAGDTTHTIAVETVDDTRDEGDETFRVLVNTGGISVNVGARGTILDDDPPPVLVLAVSPARISEEGATATVTVSTGTGSTFETDQTIDLALSGTAVAGTDYTIGSTTLTLPAGVTRQASTVTTTVTGQSDVLDEDDETVLIDASRGGVDFGSQQTITIEDDDPEPALRIGDVTGSAAPFEGSAVVFTARLAPRSGRTVMVDWAASATGAGGDSVEAEPGDLTGTLTGTLTFTAGDTARTIAVATADDTTDEHHETFTVTLSGAVNATVADGEATGEITDNDPLPLADVADASADEGSPVEFTVTLSPASERTATVFWLANALGSAEAGDLTGTLAGRLTFAAGETTQTIPVETVDDPRDEDDETLRITISPSATAGVSDSVAQGTILDNDDPPTVSVEDVSGVESSNIVFTATLSEESEKTIMVRYDVAPQSAYDAVHPDYSFDFPNRPDRRVLTFNPGVTEQTFGVYALPDTIHEGDETFTVTLSNFVNVDPGDPTRAQGTILDDDPPPVLVLAVSPARISEEGATATVTVSTGTGSTFETDQTIDLALSGPAVAGTDYTIGSTTLTLPAGEIGVFDPSTVTTTVTGQSDVLDEDDETVLIDASRGGVDFGTQQTITLVDDDPLPTIDINNVREDEGDPMTFDVTLRAPSGRTVRVEYVTRISPGLTSPAEPGDFVPVPGASPGVLEFSPGDILKQITIATVEDTIDEFIERFNVILLVDPSSNAQAGNRIGLGEIANDDEHPTVSVDDATAEEGAGAVFTASLSQRSERGITVRYQAAAGAGAAAASADDLTGTLSRTLTFGPGTLERSFTVNTRQDDVHERDELFTVRLSDYRHVTPADPTGEGTIENDDDPPAVTLALAATTIGEDGGSAAVTASLSHPSGEETTVTVTAAPVSPAASGDFTLTGNTLTIAAGERASTGTVTVAANDNETDAPDKAVTVSAVAANALGVEAGTPADVTLSITDDDPAPVPALALAPARIGENGGRTAVTATLDRPSSEDTVISVSAAPVSPAASGDFTLSGDTLTIRAGELASVGVVEIDAQNNETDALDKQVTVSATAVNGKLPAPSLAGEPASLTLTIEDDEPSPTVSLLVGAGTIRESDDAQTPAADHATEVTAMLSHPSSEQITVTVTASDDFTLSGNGRLTIVAGQTGSSAPVTLTAVDDDTDAPDKVLTVSASAALGPSAPVELGVIQPDTVPLTISDDEPPPAVTLELSSPSAGENGGTATVKATLSHPSSEQTTVTVMADPVSPALVADFTLAGSVLVIPAGAQETNGVATLTALDNGTDAPDKEVTISATAENGKRPAPSLAGEPESLTLTIEDDEPPPAVTLHLSQGTIGEDGGTATVTATLSHPSSEATAVQVSVHAESPATAADVTLIGSQLTVPAGLEASTGTVLVSANDNDVDTPDKRVTVSATADNGKLPAPSLDASLAPLTLSIADDDQRGFAWTPAALAVREGASASFEVALTAEPSADVTVTVTVPSPHGVAPGASPQDSDYAGSQTLTFTPSGWNAAQTVSLQAGTDTDTANATVQVRHTASGGGYAGVSGRYTATVVDRGGNTPVLTLSVDRAEIAEGDGTTLLRVTATLGSHDPDEHTVVVTAEPGTAAADDFAAGTFTLRVGGTRDYDGTYQTTGSLAVTPVDDGLDEDDETITVTATVEGGSVSVEPATVTIRDDDTRGVSVSLAQLELEEGGSRGYEVQLDSQPSGDVTVSPTIAGDADLGFASFTPAALSFAASDWDVPQTVTVTAAEDDDALDDQATVTHTVTGADYGANHVPAAPVQVTANDNDGRAVTVSARDLRVDEGGMATYTVALNSEPTDSVTIRPTVSGDADVTVAPPSLMFAAASWDSAQTVTVSARRDADPADDRASVSHAVSGADYGANHVPGPEIRVLVRDAGSEPGTVTLSVEPATIREGTTLRPTVTAQLSGPARGTPIVVTVQVRADTASATDFVATPAAFLLRIAAHAERGTATFRLRASGDLEAEEDETVEVIGTATGLSVTGASVTIEDDDEKGFAVSPSSLRIVEEGSAATYTVKLGSKPTGEVTVTPAVTGDTDVGDTDVQVSPPSLTFTPSNWSRAQPVTVRAAADADGDDETSTVRHEASGADYEGVSGGEVSVTVDDDDQASRAVRLSVSPERVDEAAGSQTVTVTAELDGATRASATDIAVTVTGATAAATDFAPVAGFTLTIPALEARATEIFSFAPDNDSQDEGDETVTVGGTTASGLRVDPATLTLVDDDDRGVTVSPAQLTVREEGAGVTYTVVLDTEPTGEVTVSPSVSGSSSVTVSPARLTFTASDWSEPQPVTVSAAHDDDAGDAAATVRHAVRGADYGAVREPQVAVTVTDDDQRGVVFSHPSVTLREGGRTTYTVRLATRPTGSVTVRPSVTGDADVTVSPASLGFSSSSWNRARPVTVRAEEDFDEVRDTATVSHAVSGADYGEHEVQARDMQVTVSDDDVPSTEIRLEFSTDTVREGAGTTRITVTAELDASPQAAAVEVTLSVEGVTAAAGVDFAATAPVVLTIPAGRVSATVRVAVTPVADDVDEDDGETLRIAAATSAALTLIPPSFEVTIADDDERGVTVSRTSLSVREVRSATYTVRLTSEPTRTVTVRPSVTDNADVTVTPANMEFTAQNWRTPQTVTVAAASDLDGDDETATVTHTVSGGDYSGVAADPVAVSVSDNNSPSRAVRLAVDPQRVAEDGGAQPVTVTAMLDGAVRSAPTVVTVTVTGATAQVGTDFVELPAFTLTIPAGEREWSAGVAITPVDDDLDERDETLTIGGTVPDLELQTATLTLVDDDERGFELPPGPLALDEADETTYAVALSSQPTGPVRVRVSVSGDRDVTVSPARLSFTAADWNQPQPVTVAAADDADGADDRAELRHSASGADYGGVAGGAVTVTVRDDDPRGVTVSPPAVQLREGGRTTYTVVLDTRPTGTVRITPSVTGDADVTVSPASLGFSSSSWKTPKTVTVRAAQDDDQDPDTATVSHAVAGADYDEAGTTAPPVGVTVSDDDVPSTEIRLGLSTHTVREGAGTTRITVTAELDGAPAADPVEVTLSLEGATAVAGVDFTATAPVTLTIPAGRVSATARVAVTPVADDVDEDDGETLRIAAATSSGLLLVPRSLEVTIADDDERGLTVSRPSLRVNEEGRATYTLRLASQPTGPVTVTHTVSGDSEVTVAPGSLAFTAASWDMAQTLTVSVAADPDGDHEAAAIAHRASGADYAGVDAEVAVEVRDDDPPSRAVALAVAPLEVTEDAGPRTVSVTATLDGAVRASATEVAVTVAPGTARASDYAPVTGVTVTIPPQAPSATGSFRFEPVADALDEGDGETVTVRGTATGLRVDPATLTIRDDDTRGLVVEPQSVSLGEGGGTTLSVALASQPTGPVTVRISRTGSPEVTVTPASLAFAADTWNERQVVAIEARRDEDDDLDEASLAFRASGADYGGVTAGPVTVTVAERGICYRTPQVRDVIMVRLGVLQNYRGVCADVTDEMLARLEYLTFHSDRVALTTLRAGDFAGLSGVRRIMLLDQPGLRVLPAGVFDGLEALQELWIGGSGIERIEAGAFRGLARLRRLDLADNRIEALAPGTFAGLLALQSLNLNRNRIPSFPLDELEALPNLGREDVRPTGLYIARNPGNVRGLRVSPTSLTVPRGGSATYRIGLTSAPQTPGAEVTVTAPAGVTVAPYRVKFAYLHGWFRSQEVTVTVAPEAAQGTVTLVHEVSSQPYGYLLTGEVPAVTLHIAGTASAPAGAALAGAAPAVAGMPAVTGPAGGEVYAAGDRIEARVAFDAPVTVDTAGGSPTLGLALGGVRREAAYEGGSGTAELVFALEVAAADAGAPAAHAIAHGLELGGATVRGADGTDAVLAFGAAPGVASVHIAPDAGGDGTWEAGEAVAVTLVFTEPVVVDTQDGTPSLRALVGAAEQVLAYAGGSGTSSLVFAHAVTEADEPVAAVLVAQDALALHGGAIRSTAGLDVLLAHPGAGLAGVVRLALPELAVEDAHGPEGAPLRFRVTLSPAASAPVMVDYATADDTATAADTATAGEDYTAALGTLTFAAGQSARTIAVTVLDDGHDEGAETLTLTLSNPVGARIADGEATGTIVNSDPMPRAWLGRFGRTAWEHALGAVDERLRSARVPGPRATIAGRSIGVARSAADAAQAPRLAALAAWMESRDGEPEEPEEPEVSVRELLAGSEFQVGIEPDAGGGVLTVWGHGAYGRFAGQEDDLAVSGDVASGTLGVDYAGGPWLAGLALSHSSGWGSYEQPHTAGGEVTSSLTGAYPYVSFAVVPRRLALWLAGGYGLGGLRLAPHGGTPLETRIGLLAGAAGVRATVVPAAASGGFSLAVNADGMLLRAASEATAGLAAAAAEVNRLRLGLEGSYALALGGGGRLTPSVEAALRRDGGDAESGLGMDAGGGLSYEHAALGLSLGLRGRALVVHETAELAEWGASGWLAWDPNPASELGPALTVSPSLGAPAHGGAAALWSRQTPAGLDTAAVLVAAGGRIDARFGYGLALMEGVGTPWVGIGLSEHDREYRLGYEFHAGWPPHTDLRVALEAMRRERAAAGAPEHGVTLRVTLRR